MSDAGADRCIARCKPAKAVYTSGWYESNNGLSNGKRWNTDQKVHSLYPIRKYLLVKLVEQEILPPTPHHNTNHSSYFYTTAHQDNDSNK